MTTYQKLKAENLKLKRELDIVCNDDSEQASLIKHKYIVSRKLEKAFWNGSALSNNNFTGLLKQIK